MKGFIIDDEEHPRTVLKYLIQELKIDLEIVGESNRLKEGMEKIFSLKEEEIDVLFLDIEMPDHAGLEILELYPNSIDFEIVFVTAYSRYAIQAIKLSAFDYLLKPLKTSDLLETYQRLKEKKSKKTHQNRLNTLKENLKTNSPDKYFIKSHKEEVILSLKEIIYLEASGMYTKFYTTTNKIVVSSKPLKEILNDLPEQFLRSHRSFAFNRDNVNKPISIVNGELQLVNNQTIPISVRKKEEILTLLSS